MDTSSIVTFCVCMFVAAGTTLATAAETGPRATLTLGLGEVVLAVMLGVIAWATRTPTISAAALGVVVVAVLAILAVALNRWLPRT